VLVVGYYGYFAVSKNVPLSSFLPRRLSSGRCSVLQPCSLRPHTKVVCSWLQPALVAEARIFWSQSLLKWLISYGEGLLLKLAAPELRSQDLYASVVNLGASKR
jgi:hypothetical protein